MRPQNTVARAQLDSILRRQGLCSAAELADQLGVSIPTILRIIQARSDEIVRMGTTKLARYALLRALRGKADPIPVYRINAQGQGLHCGMLNLIAPSGSILSLRSLGWPTDAEHVSGVWDGLPYPLYDMRPQGYLGRCFARKAAIDLEVPPDPDAWSDDHIAYVLSRRGADTLGNLIVGDDAYTLWLQSIAAPESAIPPEQQASRYAQMATEATAIVGGGSSVGGEFPKFTAKRTLADSATPHVIVKFSGADASAPVQRWADLLVCEHLALQAIQSNTPLLAARSRILQAEGRTFLEVERFDRSGEFGRMPLISLTSLDAAFIGLGSGDWPVLTEKLVKLAMIPKALTFESLVLWWFGRLIGNNDMHLGNLSFQFDPEQGKNATLRMAPAYDMLPMLYAPLSGGEVPARQFTPELPLPRHAEAWKLACTAAVDFWGTSSRDDRISKSFRDICSENQVQLSRLRSALL